MLDLFFSALRSTPLIHFSTAGRFFTTKITGPFRGMSRMPVNTILNAGLPVIRLTGEIDMALALGLLDEMKLLHGFFRMVGAAGV